MATRIQSVWRMHVMRKYFAMLFKEMTAGAITVQRVFRGMLVRVYGCMCVHGCMCVAVCGCVAVWLCGCVAVCVAMCGCVAVCCRQLGECTCYASPPTPLTLTA